MSGNSDDDGDSSSTAVLEWPRTMKVISGGQTGADRVALEVAQHCGFPTGGVAPPNFQFTDGPRPDIGKRYGMEEMIPDGEQPLTQSLVLRSMHNVDDSDAVVAFRFESSIGTDRTIAYSVSHKWMKLSDSMLMREVEAHYRPCLVIGGDDDDEFCEQSAARIVAFLQTHRPGVLNVCGSRVTKHDERIRAILTAAFKSIVSNAEPD